MGDMTEEAIQARHAAYRTWVRLTAEELIEAGREARRAHLVTPLVLVIVAQPGKPSASGEPGTGFDILSNFNVLEESELACALLASGLGHFSGMAPIEMEASLEPIPGGEA